MSINVILYAGNISFPLRNIFKKNKNVTIRIDEVESINTNKNNITLTNGNIEYDYLVIATGADTNYFGNTQIKNSAFPMKSTLEALQIRNQFFQTMTDSGSDRARHFLLPVGGQLYQ